jgi:hypothetical protein
MKSYRDKFFSDLRGTVSAINKPLLIKKGAGQTLLSCTVESFEFQVSIRRHKHWNTYTIDGFVNFDKPDDADAMLSVITQLSRHQVAIYRAVQKQLFKLGESCSLKLDGFLDLGNGRWFSLGGGMANYYTNEYGFDFGHEHGSEEERKTMELIEEEAGLCAVTLRAACHAFAQMRKGTLFSEPGEHTIQPPPQRSNPLVFHMADIAKTKEAKSLLLEAHKALQRADASLLRDDSPVH